MGLRDNLIAGLIDIVQWLDDSNDLSRTRLCPRYPA
jgi:hypothetical protein